MRRLKCQTHKLTGAWIPVCFAYKCCTMLVHLNCKWTLGTIPSCYKVEIKGFVGFFPRCHKVWRTEVSSCHRKYSGSPSERQQLGDVPLPFVSEKKRCLNRVDRVRGSRVCWECWLCCRNPMKSSECALKKLPRSCVTAGSLKNCFINLLKVSTSCAHGVLIHLSWEKISREKQGISLGQICTSYGFCLNTKHNLCLFLFRSRIFWLLK